MVVKRIGPYLLKAPNTIAFQKEKDPLNVNFLAIFWHFPNPLIKLNQKMLEEQGKVKKVAKWVTLPHGWRGEMVQVKVNVSSVLF